VAAGFLLLHSGPTPQPGGLARPTRSPRASPYLEQASLIWPGRGSAIRSPSLPALVSRTIFARAVPREMPFCPGKYRDANALMVLLRRHCIRDRSWARKTPTRVPKPTLPHTELH
jgi:hypothetical protein